MKLFEIPVYAFSRNHLDNIIQRKKLLLRENSELDGRKRDEGHIEKVIEMILTPFQKWDYNHIVGFITVEKTNNDIDFNLYMPNPSIKRYCWNSKNKHPLSKTEQNGYHFYIGNMKSGTELESRLKEFIKGIALDLRNQKGYYADLEAFDTLSQFLDFSKLLAS